MTTYILITNTKSNIMKNDGTAVAPPPGRGGVGVTAVASPHVHQGARRRPPPEVRSLPRLNFIFVNLT